MTSTLYQIISVAILICLTLIGCAPASPAVSEMPPREPPPTHSTDKPQIDEDLDFGQKIGKATYSHLGHHIVIVHRLELFEKATRCSLYKENLRDSQAPLDVSHLAPPFSEAEIDSLQHQKDQSISECIERCEERYEEKECSFSCHFPASYHVPELFVSIDQEALEDYLANDDIEFDQSLRHDEDALRCVAKFFDR